MGVKALPVRAEILGAGYDPAPKLGEILRTFAGENVSRAAQILADPREFFDRTVVTDSMLQILENVVQGFESGQRIFLLRSFYGGGKTHTLLSIIHAFTAPDSLLFATDIPYDRRVKLEQLANRIKALNVKVVCFSGDDSKFSGDPLTPTNVDGYSYRTVWGYVAHSIGKYHFVKDYDENLVAPQQDIVEKLLRGERVLFLFDELAEYLVRFSEKYERYAKAVVSFIELFAKAVQNSNCVAVFTIPIEEGGIDWRLNVEVVRSIQNALEKVAVSFEPLKGADVVKVLKKRVFEDIPDALKEIAVQRFREARVNYPEYFPPTYEKDVEETYPFSPEYVDVLERLVRETGLQKTRAALQITIDVVKRVLAGKDDFDVFKPWHIELQSFPEAFSKHPEYQQIYVRQTMVDPEIHALILRTIFLYTYYYDTAIARREYPGVKEIVRAVYEPSKFSKLNLDVPSIEEKLRGVVEREDILNLYYGDGKYWFWKLPSIRDYINKTAVRVLNSGDPRIWDHVKNAIEDSYNYRGSGKTKLNLTHKFQELVILESFDYPEDSERLKLVVIMDSELAKSDFPKRVIEYVGEGRERTYKNTVVVLLPHSYGREPSLSERAKYEKVLKSAAKLVAIEEVGERIGEWYTDTEIMKIQKNLLDNERRSASRELQNAVIEAYSYALYPVPGGVRDEKVSELSMNIAEGVWRAIRDKVADTLSFDYLALYIRNRFNVDVDNGDAVWTFEQIRKWFKQDPSLPLVADREIERAVIEGVREFRLGIRRGDEIFFKPVHDAIPPAKDSEGSAPSELRDSDAVMTRKRAIREQLELLKSKERAIDRTTHIEEIRYFLYPELGGTKYSIPELENMPNWETLFVSGVIVREVRKIPKDLPRLEVDIYPTTEALVKEGEAATFRIVAKPYNFAPESVKITVTSGGNVIMAEPMEKRDSQFERELTFEIEKDEETFVVDVNAGKPELAKRVVLKVKKKTKKVRRIETDEINVTHVGAILEKILDVYDFDVLKEIANDRQISGLNGKVNAKILGKERDGSMTLAFENVPLDVATHAAVDLAEYCSERTIMKFEIQFRDLKVDERLLRAVMKLNRRVKYTLLVEAEE